MDKPIHKSPFKDGWYDVEDYYKVDNKFGSIKDVIEPTSKAHSLGIKIIFDLVHWAH